MVKYEIYLEQMTKTNIMVLQIVSLIAGAVVAVSTSLFYQNAVTSYASSLFGYASIILGFYLLVVTSGKGSWDKIMKGIFGGPFQGGTAAIISQNLGIGAIEFYIIGVGWGIILSVTIFVFIAASAKAI